MVLGLIFAALAEGVGIGAGDGLTDEFVFPVLRLYVDRHHGEIGARGFLFGRRPSEKERHELSEVDERRGGKNGRPIPAANPGLDDGEREEAEAVLNREMRGRVENGGDASHEGSHCEQAGGQAGKEA